MPPDLPAFGELLQQYRHAAGLTQGQLAERAGLSARGISDLERGARRWPHPRTVRLLARALGLGGDDRATLDIAARRRDPGVATSGADAARRRQLPVPGTPLVGRQREQALLAEQLAAALAGRGGLVLLGGEAGIGKTSLLADLGREAARRGALALVGRAYDLTETPPYGPWLELFGRYPAGDGLPPLPAALAERGAIGDVASQQVLFGQVRDFLAAVAARRPLVLLLDDLHWADPASLDLLRFVARDLAAAPLLLVGTYRTDEVTRRHPLYQLLPALVREAPTERLDLRPLEDADVRALVRWRHPLPTADETRLVAWLQARARGNPFFALELLRTLEAEGLLAAQDGGWVLGDLARVGVPPLLRQLIDARLARLGDEARRLLAVAAVLGQEVEPALWAAVGGVDEETLAVVVERVAEAHLLEEPPGGAGLRFAHALIREVLYAGTPLPRRRAWHRCAAEALAALPGPDPDAVAAHYQRAGDARAYEWLVRAGVRARHAQAWVTAAERFVAAAALLAGDAARARERGWLLYYSGLLLRFTDNARAIRSLEEARRAASGADDRVLAAYARYQHGQLRCLGGDIRRGMADVERGVAGLDALPGAYHLRSNDELALATIEALLPEAERAPPTRSPRAGPVPTTTPQRGVLVNWLGHSGRYREALAMGEPFLAAMTAALGEDGAQPYPCLSGHMGLGHAYAALGRPADARREYAVARAGFRAAGDVFMVERSLWVELLMVVLPYQAEALAERAGLAAEAARAWARAGGAITTAAYASPADLLLALPEGRWAEARRLARAALGAATVGHGQGAIVALGLLARHQGEPGLAWAQVRALHPAGPGTDPGDSYFPHAIAAQALAAGLALDAGDLATAREWLAAHDRWLAWSGAVLWQAEGQLGWAEYHRAAGDLALAREHAERALAHAAEPRQPLALLAACRTLGELDTAAGRHADAAAHLDTALALAAACAAPYERALTLLATAELHHATGRGAGATGLLDEARAIFARLGATPALARAEVLASRDVASPPLDVRPASEERASLTAREGEVLRLIAAGRSNREIAEALCLSVRTVERHVEKLYRKIDAHGRADATAFAFRHHLT